MTTATLFEWPRTFARDVAAEVGRNIVRWFLLGIGMVLVVLGVLMAPIPGPLGVPVTLLGLVLILRNSFRLRRAFVRFQRKHPKTMFPMRKLLSKNPEVAAVAYHQALRIERTFLPKSWRVSRDLRHKYFRRKTS
jgi:hypothetical protein